MVKICLDILALSALLIGLPLVGALLVGNSIQAYLEFPPITHQVRHLPFSWTAFLIISVVGLFCAAVIAFGFERDRRCSPPHVTAHTFPGWGWVALVSLMSWWALAWTRMQWFDTFQILTFAPLWASYIVLLNAMTLKRTGACLITRQPRYLLALFPASALFWWYFEYLNRFVQNWHYLGVEGFSPLRYAIQATLAFSTVLPAVISTMEWLGSFPALQQTRWHARPHWVNPQRYAWIILVVAGLGLLALSIWPNVLFPLVWIAPGVIFGCLLVVFGQIQDLQETETGGWPRLVQAMLSALICGFWWECWNYYSDPKWIYSIPLVHRFKLFEMPILGYLGYLPFGLQCWLVAEQVRRRCGSA